MAIAGGGSGGHVMPGLAVVEALRRLRSDVSVAWIGATGGIEEKLVRSAGLAYVAVHAGKLNRFASTKTARDLAIIPVGCVEAVGVVRRLRPDVVLTVGGYVAVPAGIAAWMSGVPLVAHQQDVAPNLANRLLAPLASCVTVSFAPSASLVRARRVVVDGNPIRRELFEGDRERGRRRFGAPDGIGVVLALGGSQGAKGINETLFGALPALLERAIVVHMTGHPFIDAAEERRAGLPCPLRERYHPRAFLGEELPDALAAADLVISRAGASTISELAALGKPAILVPLPPGIGGSPQRANARLVARAGAALLVEQQDLSPAVLVAHVRELLADQSRLLAMGRQARRLMRRDAAERLAMRVLAMAS